jgi:hypothetical protein
MPEIYEEQLEQAHSDTFDTQLEQGYLLSTNSSNYCIISSHMNPRFEEEASRTFEGRVPTKELFCKLLQQAHNGCCSRFSK